MPLVVLSALGSDDRPPAGWSEMQQRRVLQIVQEQQATLARQIPGGRLVIAERSGHFIQEDQPDLVIAEIRPVIKDVCRGMQGRPED